MRLFTRHVSLIMMGLAALASGACATSGAVPRPFPGAPIASAPPASVAPVAPVAPGKIAPVDVAPDLRARLFDGRAVAEFALGFRGVPYRLGGTDPAGFDCSGLVQYVFTQYGIFVPRLVDQQYEAGERIKPSEIGPGDLLFFNTKKKGDGASHVAISIGGDSFVHAPNSTGVVRVETLSSTYWGGRYIGARRLTKST